MKTEVKTPVILAIAALLVIGLAFYGWKSLSNAGSLDHGQIQYTPGKPPWQETDPNKRGPGGSPGSPSGATGTTAPVNRPTAPNAPNAQPPGMTNMPGPPAIDNSKK